MRELQRRRALLLVLILCAIVLACAKKNERRRTHARGRSLVSCPPDRACVGEQCGDGLHACSDHLACQCGSGRRLFGAAHSGGSRRVSSCTCQHMPPSLPPPLPPLPSPPPPLPPAPSPPPPSPSPPPPPMICWTYWEGHYITEEHMTCNYGHSGNVDQAKALCEADALCTAISKQSNLCHGAYRVVRGGPTLVAYGPWAQYKLWSYTIDRSTTCAASCPSPDC